MLVKTMLNRSKYLHPNLHHYIFATSNNDKTKKMKTELRQAIEKILGESETKHILRTYSEKRKKGWRVKFCGATRISKTQIEKIKALQNVIKVHVSNSQPYSYNCDYY